jgi:hypothetical protein
LNYGSGSLWTGKSAFGLKRFDRWDGDTWVYRVIRPLTPKETSVVLSPLRTTSNNGHLLTTITA